jgi:hypothetical protein
LDDDDLGTEPSITKNRKKKGGFSGFYGVVTGTSGAGKRVDFRRFREIAHSAPVARTAIPAPERK